MTSEVSVRERVWRVLAAPFLVLGLASTLAQAQVDPRGPVRTIPTPHFRVHFRADSGAASATLARRVAGLAEQAYQQLSRELAPPNGPIDLLLADNVDFSNGFAQVFPTNRIVVYAAPPIASPELRFHDDWLRLVVTHELAHIFHLDRARGIWALGRRVFGRNPLFFPNAFTPSWVKEGLAIHYESQATNSGRAVSTEAPLVAWAAARDQALPPMSRWSLATSRFPRGQTAYAYGALVMQRAALAAGDSGMRRFVDATASYPIPFLLDRASRVGFGTRFSSLYQTMRDSLRAFAQVVDTAGDARWRVISTEGWFAESPRWVGRDSVLWAASNGREVTGLYVADIRETGSSVRVARRNALDVNVPLGGDSTVFAQWDLRDPYVVRSDLYAGRGANEQQLTRGARLTQPDVRRDGAIIAVQITTAATRLVRVARDGTVVPLRQDAATGTWAEPRWSPDGLRLAAVQLLPTGEQRVVVIDTTGAVQQIVSGSRAVFAAPAFTPDGGRLVWTSDRSGRMQVETAPVMRRGAPVDTLRWREPRPDVRVASDVSTAVYQPSVSPDGRQVVALLYRVDGMHVAVTALDTLGPIARNLWYTSEGVSSARVGALQADSGTERPRADRASVGGDESRAYSAVRQLWPRYWLPVVGDGRLGQSTYGVSTSAVDILQRHSWVASVEQNPTLREWDASAAYRFAGFGLPLLDFSWSQEWDATFRVVDQRRTELGSIARRRRFATVSSTFSRPRVRSSVSGNVGAQYELRDFTATTDSLLGAPDALLRRGTRYPQLFGGLNWSTVRRGALAIAHEEGVVVSASTSYRWREDAPSTGSWRSVVTGRAYVPLALPGFSRHVLSLRGAVGVADRRTATEFSVGGVSGVAAELLPGVSVGDPARTFPLRGVVSGAQRGIRALGASAEYRAPVVLLRRAPAPLTLFADRISLTLFSDAGRAWCPGSLAAQESSAGLCERPGVRDGWIASAGAELVLDLAVQYDLPYRLRIGGAAPYLAPAGIRRGGSVYVSLGSLF